MHKNIGRYFALLAVVALTIFAGKTFAESRQQPLFAEIPVIEQETSGLAMNLPDHDVSVEDDTFVLPVPASAAAPAEETVHAVQISVADTNVNSHFADTTVASTPAQHFSIKKRTGDDEDDDEGRDDDEDDDD